MKNQNSTPRDGQDTSFFKTTRATEFTVAKTGDIWVFGNLCTRIDIDTPHLYIGIDKINRSDRSHVKQRGRYIKLPITDGHGKRQYVNGWAVSIKPSGLELLTSAWTRITNEYPNAFDGWV